MSVVPASQPWNECVADTDCVALPRDCTDDGPPDACEWPRAYFVGVARDHEREYTLAICGAGRDLPAFGGSVAARCNAGRCEVRAAR